MGTPNTPDDVALISARMRMVDGQLAARGITNANVLAAMRTVPRHRFVPAERMHEAYGDYPLPIGDGQTISQPYIVGSMTQELQVDRNSRVLEVGTGSGYQTAVLAEIVQEVYSIEYYPQLLSRANDLLDELGYTNVTTILGDGSLGWEKRAPYDGIIVTAAGRSIPQSLIDQLADGGRLVIPVVTRGGLHQELMLATRSGDRISKRSLYGVRFVPLQGGDTEE
ncbi:protein-L-isoaspartate(D-aspartate) O-methyltransferase [candidate division GN15 bacterium]|nr:protein-L-isoaspartate(D-aspartate) O-methyltransferase [candidate division GN15 bacterium]